jgi:S-adenosylmethionine:tRNA ribosyltransferase-isomerase
MLTSLFDYELPERSIARHPPSERDAGRLLVLERDRLSHRRVRDFPDLVPEGALIVVNESRVRRARLLGQRRTTGGHVELLLLRRVSNRERHAWEALGRSSKPLRAGTTIDVADASGASVLAAEVLERFEDGTLRVDLGIDDVAEEEARIERVGHVPIPPYLGRPDEATDAERYQTLFAKEPGSAAAPTAGLHLSKGILERLRERGIAVEALTLHVGLATFKPVTSADLDDHPMHSEAVSVSERLAGAVELARARGAPVIAVGTTVVRALESAAADPAGRIEPFEGDTRLFIQPGYRFRVVNGLLTNFHMPKSTLLALVCAFAGRQRVLAGYAEALAQEYRFLSYGDAMWIPEPLS